VTEELWRHVAPKLGIEVTTISTQKYPALLVKEYMSDEYEKVEVNVGWLQQVVTNIRSIRSVLGISPSKQIALLFRGGSAEDAARIAKFSAQLTFLLKLERIETIVGDPPAAAPAVVGDLQLFVPLEGLVDLDAERTRLDKEIAKVSIEKDKSDAKLAKFGGNVPAAVVEQEQQRLADWTSKLQALMEQRARLN
jgi:valyl-tRNA synthetase